MPDDLLQILKLCLLALIALFFLRVLRAVWAQLKGPGEGVVATGAVGTDAPVPGPMRARRGTSALRLRIVEPARDRGRAFEVVQEVTVGRASGCGVALQDSTVSHLHARVFARDGRMWVEDLGSTNGTWLNRRRVSGPVALRRGDRLQVGTTVMEVSR